MPNGLLIIGARDKLARQQQGRFDPPEFPGAVNIPQHAPDLFREMQHHVFADADLPLAPVNEPVDIIERVHCAIP